MTKVVWNNLKYVFVQLTGQSWTGCDQFLSGVGQNKEEFIPFPLTLEVKQKQIRPRVVYI